MSVRLPIDLTQLTDVELQSLFELVDKERERRHEELNCGQFIRINQTQLRIEMLNIFDKNLVDLADLLKLFGGKLVSASKQDEISVYFRSERDLDDFMDKQDDILQQISLMTY